VGDDSHVFGQKFPGEKGSLRQSVVMMQQPVLLSPKFRAKSSHNFMQSPQNVTVVCRLDCLACREEFFMNNPHDIKENDEQALDFCFSPVSPFFGEFGLSVYWSRFLP
jgi:hypothetical protein